MPVLTHHEPGTEFDWQNSAVADWIVNQDEVRAYLFDKLSQAGLIVYDPDTCTWRGHDTPKPETDDE